MKESEKLKLTKLNDESSKGLQAKKINLAADCSKSSQVTKEVNGPKGLEPTRYGDWESKGRCFDF